jgi:hypothetical protein
MKTFILDIIPKLKRYSQKLDDKALLTNQHWVLVTEDIRQKIVYIFRDNEELLISRNGKIEKGHWEYIGNESLVIESKSEYYLFKHGFLDNNILALKLDGNKEYAVFIAEKMFFKNMTSLSNVVRFLVDTYLDNASLGKRRIDYIESKEFDIEFSFNKFTEFLNGVWTGKDRSNGTINYMFCFSGNRLDRQANYDNLFSDKPIFYTHEMIDENTICLNFTEENKLTKMIVQKESNNLIKIDNNPFKRRINKPE